MRSIAWTTLQPRTLPAGPTQGSLRGDFLADCERIHREWDKAARSLGTEGLVALYAQDAIVETPLVPAVFEGRSGILGDTDRFDHFSRKAPGAGRTS